MQNEKQRDERKIRYIFSLHKSPWCQWESRLTRTCLGDYFTAHALSEEHLFLCASANTHIMGNNKKKRYRFHGRCYENQNQSNHFVKNGAADFSIMCEFNSTSHSWVSTVGVQTVHGFKTDIKPNKCLPQSMLWLLTMWGMVLYLSVEQGGTRTRAQFGKSRWEHLSS